MALDQRKAATRAKIMLGGLVVKAGLGNADPAMILGLLIEGAAGLRDAATVDRARAVGMAAMVGRGGGDEQGGGRHVGGVEPGGEDVAREADVEP